MRILADGILHSLPTFTAGSSSFAIILRTCWRVVLSRAAELSGSHSCRIDFVPVEFCTWRGLLRLKQIYHFTGKTWYIIIAGEWCGKRDEGQKIDLTKFRISSYSINHKNRRDLKGGLHAGNQNSRVAGSREHQKLCTRSALLEA